MNTLRVKNVEFLFVLYHHVVHIVTILLSTVNIALNNV
jgi:hypothetical protein